MRKSERERGKKKKGYNYGTGVDGKGIMSVGRSSRSTCRNNQTTAATDDQDVNAPEDPGA